MLIGVDGDQLDPPLANVLLVLVLVGALAVLWGGEGHGGLTSQFTIGHLANLH
jgi:hypothetical protein